MRSELHKIIDYLLLKSPFVQDISLFHGKTGLALALYLYADKHKDKLLNEYAYDLFQQVHEEIHTDMPIGLEYGLAGIGYATTLLYKHKLVDCDLNEVLSELDSKIMERDPRRMTDMNLRTGASGIRTYIQLRMTTNERLTSFDSLYLSELHKKTVGSISEYNQPLLDILTPPDFSADEYIEKPWGIDKGSSYFILKSALL